MSEWQKFSEVKPPVDTVVLVAFKMASSGKLHVEDAVFNEDGTHCLFDGEQFTVECEPMFWKSWDVPSLDKN